MKKTIAILSLLLTVVGASAQTWWVFLADKAGTTFDPYAYFDPKAIDRYQECGADLYDISNYPLNDSYVAGVAALATEEVGCSRWMNAVGIVATPTQAAAIAELPYVTHVEMIAADMQFTSIERHQDIRTSRLQDLEVSTARRFDDSKSQSPDTTLTDQLIRMQGHLFRQAGIDGTGIRIAVLDGGFPKVDVHPAFKHLRDGHRILKTWNFPNHKEDVYGWNGHGTMTLSCIAGRMNGQDLGLATGAEFLLARTEVEPEPFKEEIWWMQGMEWADKNGANIISSSLGYGKDRYYTRDMDGTSYVARAANLAARKGMLVVNSAGNEGDDSHWQYIITPSDADSVLCIGGLTHSLTDYEHISFSSFGPSAAGLQKPNLCAFGHAWAANPHGKGGYEMVYGTSFSCPLVAGFAACAWQASKGKTNMELFDLLQQSGDLYPYCDYAFGYGVPQAGFFVGHAPEASTSQAPFRFETQSPTAVSVVFTHPDSNVHIFYKNIDDEGHILTYGKRSLGHVDTSVSIDFHGGNHLVVFARGHMDDYRFERSSRVADKREWASFHSTDPQFRIGSYDHLVRAPKQDIARENRAEWDFYLMFGLPLSFGLDPDALPCSVWSPAWRFGVRLQHHFSKAYGIGLGVEYGHSSFHFGSAPNRLDSLAGMDDIVRGLDKKVSAHCVNIGEVGIELFQRVRFLPGGMMHKGLHWDLGVYGNWGYNNYELTGSRNGDIASSRTQKLRSLDVLDGYRWNWGVTTRLTYDMLGLYARYRLNGIGQPVPDGRILLPRLEIGIQFLL